MNLLKYSGFGMRLALFLVAIALFPSCSTTKLVPSGEYRLDANSIELADGGASELKQELASYIRQTPNRKNFLGMNQMGLYVYNWSNGSSKGINKLWENLGTAPVVFNRELVDDSSENILNRLRYLGYYDASVKTDVELDEQTRLAKVNYFVKTGTRRQIDSIVFEVPSGEFEADFLVDEKNISVREGDFLSEEMLEAETQRGAFYFRNLGYYDFNKNNYFFQADTLSVPNKTILHYIIRPYTRNEIPDETRTFSKYTIDKVSIEYPGNVKLNKRKLLKLNPIVPGMVYSEDIVNLAYSRFASSNTFNSVNLELEPVDSSKLDCKVKLSGLDLYGVKFDAELSTNSSGLLGASPKISFYHKNIFRGGERLNLDFTGNWQYHPRTKAHSTTFGASASLLFPRALGFNTSRSNKVIPRTEIRISYNYQNRPEFERHISSFSYAYIGQFSEKFFYQIYPLQLSTTKLKNISGDFVDRVIVNPYLMDTFLDSFDMGVGFSLNYNSDPSIVPKTSYSSVRWSVDASGNVISLFNKYLPFYSEADSERTLFGLPYDQYVRTELALVKAFRFGLDDNAAIAFRLNAGIAYAYGNSTALPFEKQFYCGGANSMRAWQSRTLGPGSFNGDIYEFFAIPSQTGDIKLEADMELRFPLFWKIEAGLFAEAGNVWLMEDLKTENLLEGIAADWGLGLRVNLDFILLRIDAGFKMRDPSRPDGSQWLKPREWVGRNGYAVHFGVGYPF